MTITVELPVHREREGWQFPEDYRSHFLGKYRDNRNVFGASLDKTNTIAWERVTAKITTEYPELSSGQVRTLVGLVLARARDTRSKARRRGSGVDKSDRWR